MSSLHVSSGYHVAWHSVLRGYDATLKSMTSLTRFAWPFDQFKRHVYDPRAASATSALASLFWYACVTAFAAVAITNFINRPEVDTFSVMPADMVAMDAPTTKASSALAPQPRAMA